MPAITRATVIPAPSGANATLAAGRYYDEDVVTEPFRYEDGLGYSPDGPGLGVGLDEDRPASYRLDEGRRYPP